MSVSPRWAIGAWLGLLVACAWVTARATFTTDISAFLPRSPTPAQQILVEQLRDGVVSRLILIGIEGAPPGALAQTSKRLAEALRKQDAFVSVSNGDDAGFPGDRDYLWRNRYLLSPAVTAERFSAAGLRARLEENLELLASPSGMLLRRVLPGDPTGELLEVIGRFDEQARPATRDGVWFSRDGSRALLVAHTRAAGYDIDAQERVLGGVRGAFAQVASAGEARLLVYQEAASGPNLVAGGAAADIVLPGNVPATYFEGAWETADGSFAWSAAGSQTLVFEHMGVRAIIQASGGTLGQAQLTAVAEGIITARSGAQ